MKIPYIARLKSNPESRCFFQVSRRASLASYEGALTSSNEILPRRWVVERTFAWIFGNRPLVREYEQITTVAETLIAIAASATLLRRWS